ncbi:MAG: response regulator [Candidatus Korobacteraceae bacterium]|jgi:two-component system chemotaxis response regulator CheY
MRALIVDDSSAMRAILGMTLKRQGFEIVQAKDGMDALAVLTKIEPVDLILIDWNMPVMNGLQLLERIRQQHEYDHTQILMVTTETGMGQMSEALSAGANEYIMKPFTADMVMDKLRLVGL